MLLPAPPPKGSILIVVLLVLIYSVYGVQQREQAVWPTDSDHLKLHFQFPNPPNARPPPPQSTSDSPSSGTPGPRNSTAEDILSPLSPPSDHPTRPDAEQFCSERFGIEYLEGLRDSLSSHCAANSSASLLCFHSKTNQKTRRTDSFCVGGPASIRETLGRKTFSLGCHLQENDSSPRLASFPSYWYDTGPKWLLNNSVTLENPEATHLPPASQITRNAPRTFAILIKREEIVTNLWHSLMQISSLYETLDVLRMTQDPSTHQPLFTDADVPNSQIIIVDDFKDGPYIDLWRHFAPRPILRWSNLTSADAARLAGSQIILPLAGHSNSMWQGDWALHACNRSALLDTFAQRVLTHHNLSTDDATPAASTPLTLTFVDRTAKRRLVAPHPLPAALRAYFPHLTVQALDFAALPFREQLAAARRTDILVGVHGAGLTHAMFVRAGGAVVEVMPPGLDYKGFANMARMRGLGYVRAEAKGLVGEKGDWHDDDVEVEEGEWVRAVWEAVRAVQERRMG